MIIWWYLTQLTVLLQNEATTEHSIVHSVNFPGNCVQLNSFSKPLASLTGH